MQEEVRDDDAGWRRWIDLVMLTVMVTGAHGRVHRDQLMMKLILEYACLCLSIKDDLHLIHFCYLATFDWTERTFSIKILFLL